MAYCYGCGSDINKDDAFCPFCGASQQQPETGGNIESTDEALSGQLPSALIREIKSVSDEKIKMNENEAAESDKSVREIESFDKSSSEENAANNVEDKRDDSDLIDTDERQSTDADEAGNPLVRQDDLPEVPVVYEQEELPGGVENQNEYTLNEYDEAEVKEGAEVEEINDDASLFSSAAEEHQFPDSDRNTDSTSDATDPTDKDADVLDTGETVDSESPDNAAPGNETNNRPENQPESAPEQIAGKDLTGAKFQNTVSANIENENKDARSYTTPNIGSLNTDGKKSAKLKPLDEGTILNGRYEIVRKIGGGGMGAVYLATDKNLNGVLRAVKEMVQSYIEDAQQEKAVADFKRESVLLTSLEHTSIPTIYDYFFDENEGRFYLVMKYISGGDLSLRLRSSPEGRIDEKNVTEWAIQIADVLDYLHNRRPPIVYRDLKPANIMIDGNSGRAMLIDFGIARWVNKEEKGVTAVGTMGYAPPELFSGNVEPRSDIYSLGSTMFHLLTGADPQSNPLLIFDFQKNPRPRQINPQLSDQIEKILMRSVEYSADKRFTSAAELRNELEKHLERLKSKQVTHGVREVPHSIALSEQPVFCGFCGQKIVATDMFCAFCGAKQPLAQPGVHSENHSSKSATAKLLILGTNELQTPAYPIEKDDNLLGRRDPMSNIFPEVDLSKYDPQTKISRRHARIRRKGDSYFVEDLGSSNGTLVISAHRENVRLAPHKPYTLADGDKLKLGDTTLHFTSN